MPQDMPHDPHAHIEHRHEDGRDHRKERDCPGDEEPDFNTADDSGGNTPPPPPPKTKPEPEGD